MLRERARSQGDDAKVATLDKEIASLQVDAERARKELLDKDSDVRTINQKVCSLSFVVKSNRHETIHA